MTTDLVDQIFDFNEQIIGVGNPVLNVLTNAQYDWTIRAYSEEVREFGDAFREQDLLKMVDANLDLIYFAIGTLKKMGLTREQVRACMTAVHEANMTKKRGQVAARGNSDQDAVKPETFVPPEERMGKILFGE